MKSEASQEDPNWLPVPVSALLLQIEARLRPATLPLALLTSPPAAQLGGSRPDPPQAAFRTAPYNKKEDSSLQKLWT